MADENSFDFICDELASRGVEGGEQFCAALAKRVAARDDGEKADTPESIFARLGNG